MKNSLCYYVYKESFNSKKIEKFNIFNNWRFLEDIEKLFKNKPTKEQAADEIRRCLFYYYGSKCEYEIIITSWPCYISNEELNRVNEEKLRYKREYGHYPYVNNIVPTVGEKIDIRQQVLMNWDIFFDYVWNYYNK